MKILIASDCYTNNTNGVTTSILALSSALRRLGHEVKILSLSDSSRSFRSGDDYFIKSFPSLYYPDLRTSLVIKDPLLDELTAWKPDVVHVHTDGSSHRMALKIRKQCGVPLVKTCHTYYEYFAFGRFSTLPPLKVLSRFVGGRLYQQADIVTVPSYKSTGFSFLEKMSDRLVVIHNGIELDKYRNRFSEEERRAFRRHMGIEDHTGTLVTITRLSREKHIHELISFLPGLLKKNRDVKYLIVGDGPDSRHLKKLTGKLNLQNNVIFTGRIPDGDVWRFYAAGDIYAADSICEVNSMSCIEAMANGLPLLCRADESLNGVLDHGQNGLIWHSREEFVDFTCRLLEDSRLRENMARSSLEKAGSFSSDAYASAMLEVYTSAIHGSQTGSPGAAP
ncbi:MAG: glycosyltransferase [Eubacteriales bacterium]|nr:glycosyltransferase [Eubacteriales bacterium]